MSLDKSVPLGSLKKGQKGLIIRIAEGGSSGLDKRFMEMGFIEGSSVEIIHEAPFGGDPFAVRVRGSLVALRRKEAALIEVLRL